MIDPGSLYRTAKQPTSATARSSKSPPEPGRSFRCSLFARGAGVHVDFHAHRHLDDLRSFPGHSGLPSYFSLARRRAKVEPKTTPDLAQVRKTERRTRLPLRLTGRYFSLGQSHFTLGQGTRFDAQRSIPATPRIGRANCTSDPSAIVVCFSSPCRRPCVGLGALGLLRCRRLALHLPLRILRRGRSVAAGLVHRAGRRVVLGISGHAGRGLAAARRCGSGTCILEVCGAARGIARTCQRGAGAQDKDGATGENESFRIHLCLPWSRRVPRRDRTRRNRSGGFRFRVAR